MRYKTEVEIWYYLMLINAIKMNINNLNFL